MEDNINETNDKKDFIKEKIVKKTSMKSKLIKFAGLVFSAFILGATAMAGAIFTRPIFEKFADKKEKETKESIVIPRDEPETTRTEKETEPVEDIVQSAIEDYAFDVNSLKAMYLSLAELANTTDNSVVAIRTTNMEKDWFDNEVENTGELPGVIIADTETELIILSPTEGLTDIEGISVRFSDDKTYTATVKETDSHLGIALLSVQKDTLEEGTKTLAKAVTLGNSYRLKRGDILMALGSPLGIIHSSSYCNVSYISKQTPIIDSNARFVYVNGDMNNTVGTYLFNTDGELVAWLVSSDISKSKYKAAIGISDLKGLLEKMINGESSAYLGLEGTDVDGNLKNAGIESGVYIKKVVADSPAYNAGIQPGDILVGIGDKEIKSMPDYKGILSDSAIEKPVELVVMRYSREEYVKLNFAINMGAR